MTFSKLEQFKNGNWEIWKFAIRKFERWQFGFLKLWKVVTYLKTWHFWKFRNVHICFENVECSIGCLKTLTFQMFPYLFWNFCCFFISFHHFSENHECLKIVRHLFICQIYNVFHHCLELYVFSIVSELLWKSWRFRDCSHFFLKYWISKVFHICFETIFVF